MKEITISKYNFSVYHNCFSEDTEWVHAWFAALNQKNLRWYAEIESKTENTEKLATRFKKKKESWDSKAFMTL